MKSPVLFAAGILTGLTLATATVAAPVNIETTYSNVFGDGSSDAPRLYRAVSGTAMDGGSTRTVSAYAGMFRVTESGSGTDLLAFCIDFFNNLSLPGEYHRDDALLGADVRDNIDRLFTSRFGQVNTRNEAAAFQVSLWEILYDSDSASFDLNVGDFVLNSASAAVRNLANTFLNGLASAETGGYSLRFYDSRIGSQDLVAVSAVPLPAGVVLLGTGLAGFGALRLRKKKAEN